MIEKIKGILKNKSFQFTCMSAIASGINFISIIILGRIFSVEEYGEICTIQAFLANISVLITPLQILICKNLSESNETNSNEINNIISIMLAVSVIELVILMLLFVPVMKYLGLLLGIEYFLLMLLLSINNIYILLNGILQGLQEFLLLGIVMIVTYLVKIIVVIFMRLSGKGIIAVVVGCLIAYFICIVIMLIKIYELLNRYVCKFKFRIDKTALTDYIWSTIMYFVVSLYMNSGELLIANIYSSKEEVGLYSVASNLAKISVFLIATPMGTVLLPRVSSIKNDLLKRRKILLKTEFIVFAVSFIYGLLFCFISRWAIPYLYGQDYSGAIKYALTSSVFSMILSMFWIYYQYEFAIGSMKYFTKIAVVFGIIAVIFLLVLNSSLLYVPIIMSVSMLVIIVITMCKENIEKAEENDRV